LITAGVVLFVVMGVFAGYFSTRTYKMLKGLNWTRNTILTSITFPGVCFLIFFIINLFVWAEGSSAAVPFGKFPFPFSFFFFFFFFFFQKSIWFFFLWG